jgi:hypothetical protein
MNTKQVAELLGTDPRTLRQFLRSSASTFVAVGSGARYDFTERDVPTIKKKFSEWSGAVRGATTTPALVRRVRPAVPTPEGLATIGDAQRQRDHEVWAEEGPIHMPDIRDPKVRARVRRDAEDREARLMMLLMSKGMHVMQRRDKRK